MDDKIKLPEHPDPKTLFKVRRRTMIASLMLICSFSLLLLYLEAGKPGFVTSVAPLITWLYPTISLPIVGYFGNTGFDDWLRNKK